MVKIYQANFAKKKKKLESLDLEVERIISTSWLIFASHLVSRIFLVENFISNFVFPSLGIALFHY